MVTRMFAPGNGGLFLLSDLLVFHIFSHFWLEHVDGVLCFGDEVGLVFALVRAPFVEDLELPAAGLEPLRRFTIENDG
jgi:hypothetical protein